LRSPFDQSTASVSAVVNWTIGAEGLIAITAKNAQPQFQISMI
jgi:hypothetical protein